MLLILVSAGDYSGAAFHFARMPGSADLWLLVAAAGQVALLVSPAVFQRTRRGTVAGSAPTALAGRPRSLTGNSWLVRALVGDTPRVVRER